MPTQTTVPLLDLTEQYRDIGPELEAAALEVLRSGRYILGDTVESFETAIAEQIGVEHAIGVSSGTDALLVALMALGVEPGDEVITTPFTFFATGGCLSRLGAKPVFVDIDPATYLLDIDATAAAITDRTRGIVPVHLFGRCVEMAPFIELAKKHDLWILEDAAQAIGARDSSGPAGALGDLGAFSFFPAKNLGACGDAGLITTNDADRAASVRSLRVHGESSRYHHQTVGVNARIDALQAALLEVKLRHLPAWNEARRKNAARYAQLFQEAGLTEDITLPEGDGEGHQVFHQYVIRATRRDELKAHLTASGIGCAVYYPVPLHVQPCFAPLGYRAGQLPIAEKAAAEVLALPIYPELGEERQDRVVSVIRELYRR
ncbi:MAG: DegT/DnrJ/EryC1/StrS family aminotransferase [Planctomycetota bacterium]